jgi:DNA-binding SARP family transcriptional activator
MRSEGGFCSLRASSAVLYSYLPKVIHRSQSPIIKTNISNDDMSKLEVHLLGQFSVLKDEEAVEIPSRPAQSLFAYLAMTAGTNHRREKLAGLLWPEASETNARSNLRHALWRLRKAIGDEYFLADKISITFNAETDHWMDTSLLEGEDSRAGSTRDLLEGVSAYGGELLPGFYDDWVILERERYRALFEKKLQSLLDRLIEESHWAEVLEWGERWIALGHAPEPAYRALMFAHCGLGDTAGMASTYQRCIKALREELGVEPSGETKAAYEYLANGGSPITSEWTATAPVREVDATAAIHTLLERWREQGVEVLDIASLAIVQASPSHLPFKDEDASLLICSALHHAVEVSPWLERVRSEDVAAEALMEVYDSYPRPRIRARVVEALKSLDADTTTDALLRIAMEDDAAPIRSEAAVAAASRGRLEKVVDGLLKEANLRVGTAALAAFVAVADEVGLPEDVRSYPKISVALSLVQRRWKAYASTILRQSIRAALGGAIAMALVACLQLLPGAILNPEGFRQNLELAPLPMTLIASALLGLFWGGLLGGVLGFMTGFADALWQGKTNRRWRIVCAALAGLVHSFFLILISLSGGFQPAADASVYIPVYIFYGISIGGALSLVVPRLGSAVYLKAQLLNSLWAFLIISIVILPVIYIVYQEEAATAIFVDLLFALIFPFGLGITLRTRAVPSAAIQEDLV